MQSYNKYNEKAEAALDDLDSAVDDSIDKMVNHLIKTEMAEYLGFTEMEIWNLLISKLKDLQMERLKKLNKMRGEWKNGQ